MKRNIIFVIKIFSSTSLNLWARTQLAYKYNGNKILFIIIFFNAITCILEEEKQTFPGCTTLP